MPAVRSTTSPRYDRDALERIPLVTRDALRPVVGGDMVDADRRRSLREELDAGEECRPLLLAADAGADVQEVVEAIGKLGTEALRVQQPEASLVRRLTENGVDEKA